MRKKGSDLSGRCPIHKGDSDYSFHVNVEKNCFQCFAGSCKKRGNVLDFVAAMEQCTIRDAAVKIAEWFGVQSSERTSENGQTKTPPVAVVSVESRGEGTRGENKPLTFQLKGVDPDHPYLVKRGVDRKTAELFGAGFFSGKGSMSGRVVIPIHNGRGALVAYAGRAIDGSDPRYKLPAGFQKSLELYNLHRAVQDNGPRVVVIVEGFFDCMRVYQAGYPSVALMGCCMSETQQDLLVRNFRACWLMLDGDTAGRDGPTELAKALLPRMFVRVVELVNGQQPDQLDADSIRALLIG